MSKVKAVIYLEIEGKPDEISESDFVVLLQETIDDGTIDVIILDEDNGIFS